MSKTNMRNMRARFVCGVALAAFATGAAGTVAAQATTIARQDTVTVLEAASFVDTAPANAAEMLARVPGFTLVDADADVRGYAGAQGNVLIDGARPASKRESLSDLLKRIPAASVARIELIRGGVAGIDMAGYPVLANVVRRRDASVEGALQAGIVASTDGWAAPQALAEYARRWADRSLELAFNLAPELDDDSGEGINRTMSPRGVETGREALDTRTVKTKADASLTWRQPLAGGGLAANAAIRGQQARTDTDLTGVAPSAGYERIDADEDFVEAEIGGRYVRALGARDRIEMVVSQQLGWLDGLERSVDGGDTETFEEKIDTGESIARIDLTHVRSTRLSLTGGLEGAFNFLESSASLNQNGQAVRLPGSDVRIEERRVEGSVGATWKPSSEWVVEADLRVEGSAISQTGDSPLERSFTYAKPRVAISWDVDPVDQLRLSISREVGQLDFAQFVASASLETDQVTAGNETLEPDKTWRLTAAWEHSFWGNAAMTLTWMHDEIADVVDRVLVVTPTDVFDAPGNIGDGRRDVLKMDVAAPLDRFGFIGGRVKSSLLWRTSQVVDPVTGETRPISQEKPIEGVVTITQDLPNLRASWGIEISHISEHKTKYRFDEIARQSEGLGWTAFLERRIGDHWRVRGEATDLFGRGFTTRREKYDGPRSIEPVDEIEFRDRTTPGFVSLTLRRSLG